MGKRQKARHKGMGHNRSVKRGVRDLKHRGKDLDEIYESLIKERDQNGHITEETHTTPQYDVQGKGMLNTKEHCQST